jgi:hypothetical protein
MEGGRVYSAFDRDTHVRTVTVNPAQGLWWTLDFNVDPMSSLIVQFGTDGVARVLGEIVIRHGTTKLACEEFLKRYPRHDAGLFICGDASGHQQQTSGTTDYDMVQDHFAVHSSMKVEHRAPYSNPSVRERINLVNRQLKSAAGRVGLVLDPQCKELIKDLEQVNFKEGTNQIDKDRDRLRTHLSDALGYVLWQECRGSGTIGPRGFPIVGY